MVYRGGSIGGHFKKADDRTQRRNDWFLALVRESQIAGDAWIINSPGSDTVLVETLTTSGWPDELRRRNYPLREIAGGSRILPHMEASTEENRTSRLSCASPGVRARWTGRPLVSTTA
jgi:hypothetical protein